MSEPTTVESTLVKLVEFVRILGAALGFYLAYAALDAPSSPTAIRILALTFAIAMCGTLAFEGMFLATATAREKGYNRVGNTIIDPYQLQNTMWFLAATIVGVVWSVWFPHATMAFLLYAVFIGCFFVLSALNHAWQAIAHGNKTWQNISRPLLSLALVAGSVPIIMSYL